MPCNALYLAFRSLVLKCYILFPNYQWYRPIVFLTVAQPNALTAENTLVEEVFSKGGAYPIAARSNADYLMLFP